LAEHCNNRIVKCTLAIEITREGDPGAIFLLLFVVVPPARTGCSLIKGKGATIGALQTVALVFPDAILGALALKQQGLATLLRARQR